MFNLNFYSLYWGHLTSSKRSLILSSIGLILALTIFSSTSFYMDNSKSQIINGIIKDNGLENISDLNIRVSSSRFQFDAPYNSMIEVIQSTAKALNINFFKIITQQEAISNLYIKTQEIKNKDLDFSDTYTIIVEMTNDIKEELLILNEFDSFLINSRLPTETDTADQIYLLSSRRENFSSNDKIDNIFNLYQSGDIITVLDGINRNIAINFTVSGALYFQESQNDLNKISSYDGSLPPKSIYNGKFPVISFIRELMYKGNIIITPDIEKFKNLILNKVSQSSQMEKIIVGSIIFDWNRIDILNTNIIEHQIQLFDEKVRTYYSGSNLYFNSEWVLSRGQRATLEVVINLLMISFPVLIITIFLTNYSFGLIYKNTIRLIGIYKTRGATSNTILFFLLIDSFIIIIFSIIAGVLLGIPLTYAILKTDNLLSFNFPSLDFYVFNYQAISELLIYSSIGFMIITNGNRILKLSRISLFDTENPRETLEPSWKLHYWDVILICYGMIFYVLIYGLSKNPELNHSLGIIALIFYIFAYPSPFALVIGIILLCNRIIPLFLDKIGSILWLKTGDLIAFAFKNVIRHQQASTRAIMLISTLITFIIVFYSLPLSNINYNEQNLYYRYGAEASASFISSNFYNQTDMNILEKKYVQYFDSYSAYMILESDTLQLMLINTSTYLETTYSSIDYGFQLNSLNTNLRELTIQGENDSSVNILVDENYLSDFQYNNSQDITIFSNSGSNDTIQKFTIIDSFRNFPILKYNNYWRSNFGVADLQLYTLLQNKSLVNSPFSYSEGGIMFNFKSDVNQTKIASWIEGNTTLNFNGFVSKDQESYITGIQLRLFIGQINSNVFMTFVISITILTMFSFLQLTERKREIFTERALGMKLKQIAILFFIEIIILISTAIILGTILGGLLMQMLSLFVTQSSPYPIFAIVLPIDLIILTNIILLVLSLLVSIIPAYYVTKQDISTGFSGEL